MSSIEVDPMNSLNKNAESQIEIAPFEVVTVAAMQDLAPSMDWSGSISAKGDQALSEDEKAECKDILARHIVPYEGGGQMGCMDGRTRLIGPKTAGGTVGNAFRIMLASHAYEDTPSLPFEGALEIAVGIDKKYNNQPGSHDLGQCGAFAFSQYGITSIAKNPEVSKQGTVNFLSSVGGEFSEAVQENIEIAAKKIAPSSGSYLVEPHIVSELMRKYNIDALPHLESSHAERAIAVGTKPGFTIDSGAFADEASARLGKELNIFGYNWDYHNTIATELGGSLGDYYLQSVTSQDVPILGQLTDGSLEVVAYK